MMKWQSAAVLLCALVYIIDQGQAFAPSLHVSLPGQTLRSLGLRIPTLHVGPRSISGRLSTTLHASGKEEAGEVKSGGCLHGVVIAITGNFDGKREEVMELLKGNGAVFSGTVHKNVKFLVTDQAAVESQTKHVRKAEKFGTPMVQRAFLEECEKQGALVDAAPFLLK